VEGKGQPSAGRERKKEKVKPVVVTIADEKSGRSGVGFREKKVRGE